MMIDMKVTGLAVDPFTNMPVIILKDGADKHALPIWIGLGEASAIASELERVEFSRPLTHALVHEMLLAVGAAVERIEICDLREQTFYASIFLRKPDGARLEIDARPSDAIVLALRAHVPIRVAKKVIDRARRIDMRAGEDGAEPRSMRAVETPQEPRKRRREPRAAACASLLENLPDKQFGKWKM